MLKAGSPVVTPPGHPVDLRDWSNWWKYEIDANWRQHYFQIADPKFSVA
jgi:hypothetical protein